MIRRVLGTGLAVVVVSAVLGLAAPVASAQDCEALQNNYAVASAAALTRAGELHISDEDFRVLRDELQRLGADGDLTSAELVPLTLRNEAARKLSLNFTAADQKLVQDMIKSFNTFQQSCQGDPDVAVDSGAVIGTTAERSSTDQVSRVPNDAPETGDGSTEVRVTPEAVNAQVVAYLVLSTVAGVGVFTALHRSTGR